MRQFINKTLFFVIPLFLFVLLVEALYKRIPNEYSYKDNYIKTNGKQIEILVLGSSHSYRSVNPEYFDLRCFNFAMPSQSIDFDYYILDKYISILPNLKYVVLPMSYFTLTKKLEDGKEYWRKYEYVHYLDYEVPTFKEKLCLGNYLIISETRGKAILKKLLLYLLKGRNDVYCDRNGFGRWGSERQANLKISAEKAAKRHEDKNFNLNANIKYLEGIIKLCNSCDCRLILFTPPATSYYVECLDASKLRMITEKCYSLEKQFKNLSYINFLNDTAFTDNLFKDGDHLNNSGAKVLSKKLSQEIAKLD